MGGLEGLMIKANGAVRRGETEAARALYRQVLDRFPRNPRARAALAALEAANADPPPDRLESMIAAYRSGAMDEAVRQGATLAEDFPQSFAVHNLQGAALLALGVLPAAEAAFRRAIAADPDAAACYNNLAITLRRQNRTWEAEAVYREVIARHPRYADARYNLGNLLDHADRAEEAEAEFAATIEIDPAYVEAHYNLGNLRAKRGARAAAVACYRKAVALKPGHSNAHNNMGGELLLLDRIDEALEAYARALEADPGNTQAIVNRGKALVLKGALPEAIAAFRKAFEIDPADRSALLQALFEEAHICDWSHRAEYALTEGPSAAAVQPFATLPFVDDPEHQYRRSLACAAVKFGLAPASLPDPDPASRLPGDDRIRIGYFSADFHDHATMYLMSGLFREHDRTRFDVRLYSYGPPCESDASRVELRRHVDGFTEIGHLTDAQAAHRARADGLDLAIDLKGYTRGTRSAMFGLRLAPVQVSYMGYPGTLGHPAMDYFIADAVALPPGDERWFTEKIVRLAGCYQANDDRRAIIPDTRGRADWGLPEQGFVFCCFNHTYKIGPDAFAVWMRLLEAVEGSVLWLLRSNPWAEANLRREAAARGIDPARLVFSKGVPHGEHLGRLAHADLFLDTFNVNAHTTASDALWAGLPVLTLTGKQFAARVATSLVHAVGLPEMAVTDVETYEATALALARDPRRLAALRTRLAKNRLTAPLFRTADYTRRLESAFVEMHRRRQAGLNPEHFDVD
ncbi:putative O-linked N-acetylglucosamine transferase (SPINDLY family) [Novosphingobium sp. PhB165]|uniref:O-linked N-acetylglucosamine transferase, SPINDLY family protein n=1 Tax=Novosphingobium sp. PhB165 TaxID=2485105 RepID=UPI00104FEA2B|nr:glycosyltransferase family 41 protein [Novosphingobium sp. PhB165]TCM17106.1 putative O-linked N-acetylglucosamine transferase (SPINDLY family) [Novosphingobium sp. PhB165]